MDLKVVTAVKDHDVCHRIFTVWYMFGLTTPRFFLVLAIILKHVNEPLPKPKEFAPNVPEDLERIICKSLDKDPELRYQTAIELAQDLSILDETGHRRILIDPTTGMVKPRNVTYQARVPIETIDLPLRPGYRGSAKVHVDPMSLGSRLWRFVAKTFNFEL